MFALCEGSHTVRRHEQSEIPDVQFASGDQDTSVRCNACDNRNPRTDESSIVCNGEA